MLSKDVGDKHHILNGNQFPYQIVLIVGLIMFLLEGTDCDGESQCKSRAGRGSVPIILSMRRLVSTNIVDIPLYLMSNLISYSCPLVIHCYCLYSNATFTLLLNFVLFDG